MWKPSRWFKVWVYLIGKANHKDNNQFKRGQLRTSYDRIHVDCNLGQEGVKSSAIKNVIARMKKEGNLTTQKTTRGFIVTIVKYNDYQTLNNYSKNTEKKTERTRKEDTNHTINKNDKNVEEGKEINIEQNTFCTSDSFEDFWNKYPNKKGKQKAKKLFSSKIKSQKKFEELMQGLSGYIDNHEHKEITGEFCPDYQQGDTFMSKETRVDYLDTEKQEDNPYELFCKLVYPHGDFAPNVKGEKKYIEKYGVDKLKEMDRFYKEEMFLSLAKG